MAIITGVLTGLGPGPHTWKEIGQGQNAIGVLVGPRTHPRCVIPGFKGYDLGLFSQEWARKPCVNSGVPTYYARVEPIYAKMVDVNGDPLKGPPNLETPGQGTTFSFDPFPDGYPCTGYRVYAGTTAGLLYYQGELIGKDQTTFIVGTTWTYNGGPDGLLDALVAGPPPSATLAEVYQEEGAVESRLFLGGGKLYKDGYAYVEPSGAPPILICGLSTPSDFADSYWGSLTNGSFRMRIDGLVWDFTGINTSAATSIGEVAQIIQAKIRAAQAGYLSAGPLVKESEYELLATLQEIADGRFDITLAGILKGIGDVNFAANLWAGTSSPVVSMAEAAKVVQTSLQRAGCPILVSWDTVRKAMFLEYDSGYAVPELLRETNFATDFGEGSPWNAESDDWILAPSAVPPEAQFNSGPGESIRNGGFATTDNWTFNPTPSTHWSIDTINQRAVCNSGTINECSDPGMTGAGIWVNYDSLSNWTFAGGKLVYSHTTSSTSDGIGMATGHTAGTYFSGWIKVTACAGTLRIYMGASPATYETSFNAKEITEPGTYWFDGTSGGDGVYIVFVCIGDPPSGSPYIEIDECCITTGANSNNQAILQSGMSLDVAGLWDVSFLVNGGAGLLTGEWVKALLVSRNLDGTVKESIHGELHGSADGGTYSCTFDVGTGGKFTEVWIRGICIGTTGLNFYIDNVSCVMNTPDDSTALRQFIGFCGGQTLAVAFNLTNALGTEGVDVRVVDADGNVGDSSGSQLGTGAKSFDLTIPLDGNHYDTIEFRNVHGGGGSAYELNTPTVKVKAAAVFPISYLEDPGSAIGTSIAEILLCQATSDGVYLANQSKLATFEVVTWVDQHFEIKSANEGDLYSLGFLETARFNVGTDISGAGYLDGREEDGRAAYTYGRYKGRLLTGLGTEFGQWCVGMLFRASVDSEGVLVAQFVDETHLVLDEEYGGDALLGYRNYVLKPFDVQLHPSLRGNPFGFDPNEIIPLPTSDSDGMTALRKVGTNIAIFMQHHIWLIDGVDLATPRLLSDVYGSPNQENVVAFGQGLAVFTGEDFIVVSAGRVQTLDPDNRVKDLISRIEDNGLSSHGRLVETDRGTVIKWFVKLDGSDTHNKAIVFDPRTSDFWTENVYPDALCSGVIRDENDEPILYTSSRTDPFYEEFKDPDALFRSRLFRHGREYKNDGAPSGMTAQGLISAVSAGSFYGYFTNGGTAEADTALWNTLTNASFGIFVNGKRYYCGPVDFSSAADINAVATLIKNAINATDVPSDVGSTVKVATWGVDVQYFQFGFDVGATHVVIGPFFPYFYDNDSTDISGPDWMNCRTMYPGPLSLRVTGLTLTKFDGSTITDPSAQADVQGLYIYVCDPNGRNGQYHQVVGWNTTFHRAHIPPETVVSVQAGWRWYLGVINPRWKKWFDWNSPAHKQKTHALSVTVDPNQPALGNTLFVHQYQDLVDTIRRTNLVQIGQGYDTVHRVDLRDKPATQHGIEVMRPSSEYDLAIEDMTITHRPVV